MKLEEFKQAADIAQEVDVECKNFIYCYYDKALKKFHPPFVNDKEPAFMVDGLRASIIKGTAKQKEMAGLEFRFVGTFELTKGKTEVFEVPSIIADLDVMFEKFGGALNETC